MRRPAILACAFGVIAAGDALAAEWDRPGWRLTFQDELDGNALDTTAWIRRYKWGEAQINGELQAYVDDAFRVSGGVLTILGEHRTGQYAGRTWQYTSGVIASRHEQRYGYFEAKVKVPRGQGLWPAFWLLGENGSPGVNEIDILEILGHQPNILYMNVHWGTDYGAGHESDGSSWTGPDFSADFHTFGLEWSPSEIVWTVDGVERKRHAGPVGVPQVEMYIILNLAIGGGWPGAPDATTMFPAGYEIEYVRAYTRAPDGGAGDAGSSMDAGAVDAGAGSPDVEIADAGGGEDATRDAEPARDAEAAPEDAGFMDVLSAPFDVGLAGAPDGGCGCTHTGAAPPRGTALLTWIALAAALGLSRVTAPRRRRRARPDRAP